MITQVITFWGIVQGVGFRPTLSRIAGKHSYKGQVRNMGGLVQLIVTDTEERIGEFIEIIRREKPRMSEIMRIDRETIDTVLFDRFEIVDSTNDADEIAIVPADIAMCDSCYAEFRDPGNPRYRHPFISCTNCGPRYTIMENLPYDRDTTTMDDFEMCGFCAGEYKDPTSRRYHAQTISCHDCGPVPVWKGKGDGLTDVPVKAENDASVEYAISAINVGGVIALKGIGGYYFVCSPYKADAVSRLREIKIREEKPFAVMFGDVDLIRDYCSVSPEEEALLTSSARPVVLLEKSKSSSFAFTFDFASNVCNNSRFIGAFLPSMGLQYLLLDDCGPLIMTSANLSDLPIIKDDDEMFGLLEREPLLDGVLYNERRIALSVDDSVARVFDGSPQVTRRSKGYTPVPVYVRGTGRLTEDNQIFAAGGHLKAAFSLSKGSFVYLSQHIGDLDSLESERIYRLHYLRMKEFFGISPRLIVCDMHPDYFSTRFAESIVIAQEPENPERLSGGRTSYDCNFVEMRPHGLGGSRWTPCEPTPPETAPDSPAPGVLYVQHHHAHVASVMAEHGLLGPVIGVAFDGTGFGSDGTVWGGEILICEGASFERFSHLKTIGMIGGDSSVRDGWKSAMSHRFALAPNGYVSDCHEFEIDLSQILRYAAANDTLKDYESQRPAVEAAIEQGIHTIRTSGMGRLFDAVSSLLGIHHVNRYEGECAIMLENAAHSAILNPEKDEAAGLALLFHKNVAEAALVQCRNAREAFHTNTVCISGGVFQNKILMEEVLRLLRSDGFKPYFNVAVPPNDGGIALGQNYIGMAYAL